MTNYRILCEECNKKAFELEKADLLAERVALINNCIISRYEGQGHERDPD